MNMTVTRSPFFYVGDKYKLMPQLRQLFPQNISMYVEPFIGGGSSLLNTNAKTFWANDIDSNVIKLHRFISSFSQKPQKLFDLLWDTIEKYALSCSYKGITAPESLKKEYPKTYYSHFNKQGYLQMREDFNSDKDNCILLYLLLIYGFNHMIRYNASGDFNLPVGNVDFNKNVHCALNDYLAFMRENTVNWFESDYSSFCEQLPLQTESTYVFCDPPYLISSSEYNKLWDVENEKKFYSFLDQLDSRGIKFGLTNLAFHKGQINRIFIEWAKKYAVYNLESNYISFNDNSIKAGSREFFVTNYELKQSTLKTILLEDFNDVERNYNIKDKESDTNYQPDLFDVNQ